MTEHEALRAWRDAERAYRDEASRHVVFWWEADAGGDTSVPMPEVLDTVALERLSELRKAAQAAQDAYREMTGR